MRKRRNTQTSYTVLAVIDMGDGRLGEAEGTTFDTMAEAVADAEDTGGHAMVRENRVVWLSPSLEVKILDRKVKRDIAARMRRDSNDN